MLTVHHLGISQSERIIWLCEELGLDYALKAYSRAPAGGSPPEYLALHPMGLAPVITDGDLVLAESGAIMEYVIVKHGGGRLAVAPDQPNYADYLFWFHFANGTLMPSRMQDFIISYMKPGEGPRLPNVRMVRALQMMEKRLSEVPFLAGAEFTAADIITTFPLITMNAFIPQDLAEYPHVQEYLTRLTERPAYKRALAADQPFLKNYAR